MSAADMTDDAIGERWRKAVGKGLSIGTPVYGGTPTIEYQASCESLIWETSQFNVQSIGFLRLNGESLVPRARNWIASTFLEKTKHDWLLWIDADITFKPADVLRLLESGHKVVGGAYPRKTIEWATVAKAQAQGLPEPQRFASSYVVNLLPEDQAEGCVSFDEQGCVEVLDLPTGFLLVHREVFEGLIAKCEERERRMLAALAESNLPDEAKAWFGDKVGRIRYRDDSGSGRDLYDLFPCPVTFEQGRWRYLSEDYGFCRMWQSIGGKTYLQPAIELDHTGRHTYKGNAELVLDGCAP